MRYDKKKNIQNLIMSVNILNHLLCSSHQSKSSFAADHRPIFQMRQLDHKPVRSHVSSSVVGPGLEPRHLPAGWFVFSSSSPSTGNHLQEVRERRRADERRDLRQRWRTVVREGAVVLTALQLRSQSHGRKHGVSLVRSSVSRSWAEADLSVCKKTHLGLWLTGEVGEGKRRGQRCKPWQSSPCKGALFKSCH